MMKNQSEKELRKRARQYFKIYNSTVRNALKHEINDYLQNKKQKDINNELKTLKLSKLISNNISERDLVNIRELNVLPIKTLRQIAKLRNINSSTSKSFVILALLRSESVINERKYIIDNVNEIHSKINDIRLQLFQVSSYVLIKKNIVKLEKDYMIQKKLQILINH